LNFIIILSGGIFVSIKSDEIADFFRQLSLLVKSNLPLPESLRNIAENTGKNEFRRIIEDIARQVANGSKFSEAVNEHAFYFSEYQIKMIETGERTGSLSEVLKEIATTTQVNNRIANIFRAAAFYPLLIVTFALALILTISYFIVSEFKHIFDDLLQGEPLPALTQFSLNISKFVVENPWAAVALVLCVPVFGMWLLGPSISARKLLLGFIKIMPFAKEVFKNLIMARFCMTWATLLDRKISDADCFRMIAESIGDISLKKAFYKVSEAIENGADTAEELKKTGEVSHLIPMIIKHSDEGELPDELRSLAELFWNKASMGSKKFEVAWQAILIVIIAFFVGGIVVSLFLPLIKIVEKLS
jgi:type IV pilus assembly protein PilC